MERPAILLKPPDVTLPSAQEVLLSSVQNLPKSLSCILRAAGLKEHGVMQRSKRWIRKAKPQGGLREVIHLTRRKDPHPEPIDLGHNGGYLISQVQTPTDDLRHREIAVAYGDPVVSPSATISPLLQMKRKIPK